jgi:hypothetical protein
MHYYSAFSIQFQEKGTRMRLRRSSLKRLITLAGLLLLGLTFAAPLSPTTEAAVSGCRTDPIVILSDGTILDVTAEIGTSVSNVREIHYLIHGPRGVRLIASISTPTLGFTGKETFTYRDDASSRQYITETIVQTTYDNVVVTAHTTFAKATIGLQDPLSLQYKPIVGFNNQVLRAWLQR